MATEPKETVEEFDVMLSYQWGHQETVKQMKSYLEARNLKVWMDIQQISGNIYDKMAAAVKNSKVIVLCMNDKYQHSDNCQKEYNFMAKKKKPFVAVYMEKFEVVDNSLDIILGQQLYFKMVDGFNENRMEQIYQDILKKKGELK